MTQQNKDIKSGQTRSSIRLNISLEKQSEAFDLLESVREQIQFEPNCIHSRLYKGANEAETVMIEEIWDNDEDLQRHLRSDAYRRILLAIEMADSQPEIRFDRIIESSGMETIMKARGEE